MPVECSKEIKQINQKEFHDIDEIIIKKAFEIHNSFGRFCDEKIYSNQLANLSVSQGFATEQEVCVKVSFNDFVKLYYLDLLIENGIIYELKTVKKLNDAHEQQLINYLLLTNLNHGQLINFRPISVEKQFVSSNLNLSLRKKYSFDFQNWDESITKSLELKHILTEFLDDWGAFLDFKLYNEALIFFLGGKDNVIKPINIINGKKIVAQQKIALLNKTTAFHISGLADNLILYENHITRLLKHTELQAIQWINFNKNEIKFKTIKKL